MKELRLRFYNLPQDTQKWGTPIRSCVWRGLSWCLGSHNSNRDSSNTTSIDYNLYLESEQGTPLRGGRGLGKSRANPGIKKIQMRTWSLERWRSCPRSQLGQAGVWMWGLQLQVCSLPLSARDFWSVLPGLQDALGCGCQKESGGAVGGKTIFPTVPQPMPER